MKITFAAVRHFVLFLAIGFAWGFVAKTIVGKYVYIGYDDPQVIRELDHFDLNKTVRQESQNFELFQLEEQEQSQRLESAMNTYNLF